MTVPVLKSDSVNLITSKHGDFFGPLVSVHSRKASSLSVFLTCCKGNLCREGFRLVVQIMDMTNLP
jgi:hypothetical protein